MKYLIYNTKTEALDRDAEEALSRGCKGQTKYWWAARITKAGKWALCIPDNDQSGLTPKEKSNLKDSVVWPDPVDPS
jgi:hypothetical protein